MGAIETPINIEQENRIIGVELAVTPPGSNEVELEMFECKHTIPVPIYFQRDFQARITLHTTRGDITFNGPFQPGNYRMY